MKTEQQILKEYNEVSKRTWPYGFKSWMNRLWQVFKSHGHFKDSSPLEAMLLLDPGAWMVFFMEGYSPKQAYFQDLKEQ